MGTVNVNRSNPDQFYRYKMPRILAKVEGKGNGIKTVIVNMPEVAKALSRPPTYPCKFFGCELGAQTQFDLKNDRFIVNGAHECNKLQDLLDIFIKKFVLCPECENPETNLNVSAKKGMITQRCIACGNLGNIDMRHKLTTFILKNPPGQDPATTSATPSKKEKRKGKGKKGSETAENGDAENGDTTPNIKAVPQPIDDDEDDDDWCEDVTPSAQQQRMEELTDAAKTLAVSEDLERTPQERADIFYEFVKGKKAEKGLVAGADKDILAEADRLEVKDKAPLILVEILLNADILTQIKQYRTLFLRFTHDNQKAQKYLLGAIEQLVGNVYMEALMPKVPHILKSLYDCDIVEEAVIIDWGNKASKKYVSKEVSKEIHTKAEPFLKWLKEAEEETSEDEEEDDVEVVYSHTEKPGAQTISTAAEEKVDEDDFDIDAI